MCAAAIVANSSLTHGTSQVFTTIVGTLRGAVAGEVLALNAAIVDVFVKHKYKAHMLQRCATGCTPLTPHCVLLPGTQCAWSILGLSQSSLAGLVGLRLAEMVLEVEQAQLVQPPPWPTLQASCSR